MRLLLLASSLTEVRPGLIFWTLVTFVILIFVLRRFAWTPILDLVDEREKQIKSSIETARRERAEAEKMLADQKTAIADARKEAAEMMRKGQAEMEAFKEQLMADARKKADEELTNARRQIHEEQAKAVAQVKAVAVDLALAVAEKLINERMDDKKQRQLAEQFIEQLPKQARV